MKEINYVKVDKNTSHWLVREDFIYAFRKVFSGPPYYKQHSYNYVRDGIWRSLINKGFIILGYEGKKIAGFGCAIHILDPSAADVLEFIGNHVDNQLTWYMSELGVLEEYRGQGIAYRLVLERLTRIRDTGGLYYCFETAKKGSNSEHLYRKIKALQIEVDSGEGGSLYFMGSCDEAIFTLRTLI